MLVQLWQNLISPGHSLHANKLLVKFMIALNLALRCLLSPSVAVAKLASMKHALIKPCNSQSYIGYNPVCKNYNKQPQKLDSTVSFMPALSDVCS